VRDDHSARFAHWPTGLVKAVSETPQSSKIPTGSSTFKKNKSPNRATSTSDYHSWTVRSNLWPLATAPASSTKFLRSRGLRQAANAPLRTVTHLHHPKNSSCVPFLCPGDAVLCWCKVVASRANCFTCRASRAGVEAIAKAKLLATELLHPRASSWGIGGAVEYPVLSTE